MPRQDVEDNTVTAVLFPRKGRYLRIGLEISTIELFVSSVTIVFELLFREWVVDVMARSQGVGRKRGVKGLILLRTRHDSRLRFTWFLILNNLPE